MPASVAKAQYKKYEQSPARTDYIEFEGRPHLHMAATGWEEVAAAIDSWLATHEGELVKITDKTDYSRFVRPTTRTRGSGWTTSRFTS